MTVRFKADKYLTELSESGIGDGCFDPEYVKEVDGAAISLLNDMTRMCGAANSDDLAPEVFNKQAVTKAQLAEWLYSAVYLTTFCRPYFISPFKEIYKSKKGTYVR